MDQGIELKEYAKRLIRQVEANTLGQATQQDLRNHLASCLPLPLAQVRSLNAVDIGKLGTELYNAATRANREAPEHCPGSILGLLRAFALSLVEAAYRASVKRGGPDNDMQVRVITVSLKAARTCIENAELAICGQIFQAAADHVKSLDESKRGKDTDNGDAVHQVIRRMISDFWILRATYAWKSNNLHLAEHHLKSVKLDVDSDEGISGLVRLADLQYEIGKDLLRKHEWHGAVTWLERSCNVLDSIDPSRLSEDTMELRMSAMHDLVKALLGCKDEKSMNRAADLIALLEGEFGNKMAISMLKLELLSMRDPVPADEYQRVIVTMMTSVVLNDPNFKTIMHHIQKLRGCNASLAAKTLDSFLEVRLYRENNMVYIEKTLVTRVWISTSQAVSLEEVQFLAATVNKIYDATRQPLSADATHAAQTLMWKSIDTASATGNFETAKAWCRLTQHSLFDNAGEINKCKLARKMMSLALSQNDSDAAREAFFQMPESGRDAILTRYLMYRVGLYSQDEELTMSSLDKIVVQTTDKDATYLYACVLEAQKAGHRKHTVIVLQKVLEKFNYASPPGIYLPALLRTTALMMMKEVESVDSSISIDDALTELCRIFEAAVLQEKQFHDTNEESSRAEIYQLELSWFAKTSYNLACKYCENASPTLLVRLVQSSLKLIKLLRGLGEPAALTKLVEREGSCHFLIVSASIVLARSEDNIQTSKQHYITVRKHVEAFLADANTDNADGRAKASQLLQFDLEAILKLEIWDDLDKMFTKYLKLDDVEYLEAFADLVLVVHAHMVNTGVDQSHHEKFPAVMQKIINQSHRHTKNDTPKLARWLRCVFRMTLTTDPVTSLKILDQVVAVSNDRYPKDELDWLACIAFNQCVDFHLASDTKGAQIWGDKALNLARLSSPALFQKMQGLRMRMNGMGEI